MNNSSKTIFFYLLFPGNCELQLSEAGGYHAVVCQRRPQLRDGHVEQAEVRGVPAQRLHHQGGHRGQEDVLHPTRCDQRADQRNYGHEAF